MLCNVLLFWDRLNADSHKLWPANQSTSHGCQCFSLRQAKGGNDLGMWGAVGSLELILVGGECRTTPEGKLQAPEHSLYLIRLYLCNTNSKIKITRQWLQSIKQKQAGCGHIAGSRCLKTGPYTIAMATHPWLKVVPNKVFHWPHSKQELSFEIQNSPKHRSSFVYYYVLLSSVFLQKQLHKNNTHTYIRIYIK